MRGRLQLATVAVIAGCITGAPARVRFANAPVIGAVDDRRDVPAQPAERMFLHDVYHYDGLFQRRITRALDVPRQRRALGVNALDEVPDSTWFTNRIGARELSPAEVGQGPLTIDSPELHKPWTVRSTKLGGTSVGLMIKDARGLKYMLKFDSLGFPEVETGAHVVVNRLLWACGYNVPEDEIVYFQRADLVVARDAEVKTKVGGQTKKLDAAELDRQLAQVEREPDGRYRALASRWLAGKPLGGHPSEGVRRDDPNDRIPHELRRDLRGAYPMFAWLDHVDVQEGNFLDMWVQDPADANRHYVKHYLIDFGKSLGTMASTGFDRRRGHTYFIDFADMARSLVTAGTLPRSWADRSSPAIRGVALFEAAAFDPGAWHPDSPAYVPFLYADDLDKLWGARILSRFTRAQIRAAVEAGRFSDPRATDYLTEILIARRRATLAYWFSRGAPLDHVALTARGELCFDDLAITNGLEPAAATRYRLTRRDWDGQVLGPAVELRAAPQGRTCSGPVTLAASNHGYTIVELEVTRPGLTATTLVHVARDPGSQVPRLIGIWRQ